MSTFERRLKVNKTDSFTLDVGSWADSEIVNSLTVTNPNGGVTVGASSFVDNKLSVLLTGASTGSAEIHFDYTTATRSDCYKAIVEVINDC